jgi:hypothetical protein
MRAQKEQSSVNDDPTSPKLRLIPASSRAAPDIENQIANLPTEGRIWAKIKHILGRAKDLTWVGFGGWLITGGPTGKLTTMPEIIFNGVAMGAAAFLLILENIYSTPRNNEFAKLQNDLTTLQGRREELLRVKLHYIENAKDLFHYYTLKEDVNRFFPKQSNGKNSNHGKVSRTLEHINTLSKGNKQLAKHYTTLRDDARALKKNMRDIPDTVKEARAITLKMRQYRQLAEENYYDARGSLVKFVLSSLLITAVVPVAKFGFINFLWLTPNALFAADANFVTSDRFIYAVIIIAGLLAIYEGFSVARDKINEFKDGRQTLQKIDQAIASTDELIEDCFTLSQEERGWIHSVAPETAHPLVKNNYKAENDLKVLGWMTNRDGLHVDPDYDAFTGNAGSNVYSTRQSVVRASDVAGRQTFPTKDQANGHNEDDGYQLRSSNTSRGSDLF